MHNILLKMFLFLFLFFSMLWLCSFFRLKELFQVKNGFTTSLLFFFLKMPKIWVGRMTLNGEKKRMALWPLKTIHVIYVILEEYTFSQFFFQLLTWTILGNPVNTTEKSTLKFSKTAKFERNLSKTIQTSVNFCNFTELYLCSLETYHFQIWQFY